MVIGRLRRTAESPHNAVAPAVMVAAAALPEWEGFLENSVGGSSPIAFLGLTDSTQLTGLETAPQGVARLTM